MGGIDHEKVHTSRCERFGALSSVGHANGCCNSQTTVRVERSVRVLDPLVDVLNRDQALQNTGLVDQRKFLDPVPVENRYCVLKAGADGCRHETFGRHELGDGLAELAWRAEAYVAIGEDAHETAVGITDRHTADLVTSHQLLGIVEGGGRRQVDRSGDHASLGPLDSVDLLGLLLDGQVSVQYTDSASSGHGNRERRLGDRVHRSRHEGNGQLYPCDRR